MQKNPLPRPSREELAAIMGKDHIALLEEALGKVRSRYEMDELWTPDRKSGIGELKFRRGGKTLITFLLDAQGARALIIYGRKERDAFDALRDSFCAAICTVYDESRTYHDGKWMAFPVERADIREQLLALLAIKRRPNRKNLSQNYA